MEIIHFETLGCKLNQIETESLAHAFREAGFTVDLKAEAEGRILAPAEKTPLSLGSEAISVAPVYLPVGIQTLQKTPQHPPTPGLCIVNTCTVTGKAEQKARRLIRLLLRNYPSAPVLVTGCYAEVESAAIAAIDPRICVFPGLRKGELVDLPAYLSRRQTLHPEEPLADALRDFCNRIVPDPETLERPSAPEKTASDSSSTFRLSTDDFLFHSRASIKIQDGCGNHCTYCRIRIARGKAVSLDAGEVISRVKKIEDAGWGEVILAGVNLSQYRSGTGDFADLLESLLKETSKIAIRISSLYPERIDDAILPMLSHERICPHFHLSVQSGSDRILRAMKRPYASETVYRAAERLRSIRENPFLACDIITGFPGETEADFAETLELCSRIGFAWIHAFPFSPRPGTEAWNMKPHIPERIAGERVAILTALAEKNHRSYEEYWQGRILPAIAEQSAAGEAATVVTENYLAAKILPRMEPVPRGERIYVKLTGKGTAELESRKSPHYT